MNALQQCLAQLALVIEAVISLPPGRERRRRGPRAAESLQQVLVEQRQYGAFPVPRGIVGQGRHPIRGSAEWHIEPCDGLRHRGGSPAMHSDDEDARGGSSREIIAGGTRRGDPIARAGQRATVASRTIPGGDSL